MSVYEVLAAVLATLGVAAAVGAPHGARWWVSNALASSSPVYPLIGERTPEWVSAMVALTALWGAAKIFSLNAHSEGLSTIERVRYVVTFYDIRRASKTDRSFDAYGLARSLGALAIATVTLIFAIDVDSLAARWGLAAAFGYAAWSALSGLALFAARAFGEEPPLMHDQPMRSRSVGEFWHRRWNRIIGAWLEETFFRPLARRRHPRLGIVAAFVASAVLHFYFIYVPLGLKWAVMIASFFILQIVYLFGERLLRVARWPSWARRAWVVTLLVGASPLHMEPCLQLVERSISRTADSDARDAEDRVENRSSRIYR